MNRKRILILCALAALIAAAVAVLLLIIPNSRQQSGPSTNDVYYYDNGTPVADPDIVGTWRNADNPQWYKVYYDDYEGDGYFWGKMWDEAEDVYEEDLTYHGNGWFLWRKEGKELKELHQMDLGNASVPKIWRLKTKPDSLLLFLPDQKKVCDRFGRAEESDYYDE